MEIKTTEEIVKVDLNDYKTIELIVSEFTKRQESFGIDLTDEQISNIETLAKLLYFPNKDNHITPIIANVPMGEGKSKMLIEFIRYMYDNYPDFGVIVVKKTLDECHEFCGNFGVIDKVLAEYAFDFDEDAMAKVYKDYMKGNKTFFDGQDYIGGQKGFAARVIRGFNFGDCIKYRDASTLWYFGELPNDFVNYDYRLCSNCHIYTCSARLSKIEQSEHRILAITHTRLFYSNFDEEFLESLIYFERKGEKIKRYALIIDEKIDMCDVVKITERQFINLKRLIDKTFPEYSELFNEIEDYINSLDYANKTNQPSIEQNKFFRDGTGFEFEESLIKKFYKNPKTISKEDYEALIILQKILNSQKITTYIPLQKTEKDQPLKREIYCYNYIDLMAYSKDFEKTIILDATAHLDYDYSNASSLFCSDIKMTKQDINIFTPLHETNTSKSKIIQRGKFYSSDNRQAIYIENVEKIVKECINIMQSETKNTLIVIYKQIGYEGNLFEFRNDFENSMKKLYKYNDYVITHHGEYTTGVNHLSVNEKVIFVGMLNKSLVYYENKCLAVGRRLSEDGTVIKENSLTEINDYLITTIQQIGRTAYRRKQVVDVYIFCRNILADFIKLELGKYFSVNSFFFENIYYFKEPTKQDLLIGRIKLLLEEASIKKGDIIMKTDIFKICDEVEVDIDKTITRKVPFKRKLKDLGLISNPKNNRQFIYISNE